MYQPTSRNDAAASLTALERHPVTDTIITVQGRFSTFTAPERAKVEAVTSCDGALRETVFNRAMTAAGIIRELIEALHSPAAGPITWYASDSVQVWSTRPWSADGAQLPLVFHSRVSFTVKFSDFEALARWIESVAVIDGTTIGHIEWDLTEAKRTAVIAEVRSRAVKDAVAKASVYAQSIGLGAVRAIAIADPGMLGDQVASGATPIMHSMSRMAAAGQAELVLVPEQIEIEAVVDARFIAH